MLALKGNGRNSSAQLKKYYNVYKQHGFTVSSLFCIWFKFKTCGAFASFVIIYLAMHIKQIYRWLTYFQTACSWSCIWWHLGRRWRWKSILWWILLPDLQPNLQTSTSEENISAPESGKESPNFNGLFLFSPHSTIRKSLENVEEQLD